MPHELCESVIRRARVPRSERNFDSTKAARRPGKQDVNGHKRGLVTGKCLAQVRTQSAKRTDIFCHFTASGGAESEPRDLGCERAHEPVSLRFWGAVNNIKSFFQSCEQLRNFFRRML